MNGKKKVNLKLSSLPGKVTSSSQATSASQVASSKKQRQPLSNPSSSQVASSKKQRQPLSIPSTKSFENVPKQTKTNGDVIQLSYNQNSPKGAFSYLSQFTLIDYLNEILVISSPYQKDLYVGHFWDSLELLSSPNGTQAIWKAGKTLVVQLAEKPFNIEGYYFDLGSDEKMEDWIFEGSNDQRKWIKLDEQKGNSTFSKGNRRGYFGLQTPGSFLYFRLKIKDSISKDTKSFVIQHFDIFGSFQGSSVTRINGFYNKASETMKNLTVREFSFSSNDRSGLLKFLAQLPSSDIFQYFELKPFPSVINFFQFDDFQLKGINFSTITIIFRSNYSFHATGVRLKSADSLVPEAFLHNGDAIWLDFSTEFLEKDVPLVNPNFSDSFVFCHRKWNVFKDTKKVPPSMDRDENCCLSNFEIFGTLKHN